MANIFTDFVAGVAKNAKDLAERKAKAYAPKHLAATTESSLAQSGEEFIITISMKGKDAWAREFGSGIHSQRGPKAKYPIKPKGHKYLAFYWEKADPSIPTLPDGRVLLKEVQHPGFEAANNGQGYMRPTARDAINFIKSEIRSGATVAIKAEITSGIRKENVT